ncbi:uncharacterized protein J8A68_004501 [[Candida] subhashii]|uniref:Major facilitator superfamily (MFS) profile domain-containing protein n=1 Tax=[Candida] subhashii TaxID=561895 RepID=A0A8J5QB35_9ASCO|nr:uncharacterized protein J8A68_004501 [[Candida] subhashii]KAG7662001.1 hypothetical protein J8A68_004501 [[Candida] subhashii]
MTNLERSESQETSIEDDIECLNEDHVSKELQKTTSAVSVVYFAIPNFEEISRFREILFMAFMCTSQLLTQAAVAQTMNTSVEISETFNVSTKPGEISWFAAAFSMTVGTFILISGRLGDMFGYKRMYIIGYIWFGIASLLCGFAGLTKEPIFFDTMRALQGIGPAIMMPNTQALIGSFYPEGMRKNICMAMFGAVAPSGFLVGALFSGLLTVRVWWAWTFWICGIVSIMVAVASFFVIPKRIGVKSGGSFDYWGSLFGVSGLVLINFAFNQGPNVGWSTVYVYVLLIVGFICMGIFYLVEKRVKDPLVPPEVLKGETGFVLGCIAAGWSCFGVWLFYQFRWALIVDNNNPIIAAVTNIPTGFVGVFAAITTALLLMKIPSAVVMFFAMLAFLVGIVLMGTRPVGQTYWAQKFVSLLIQPMGMDMSFPAACILLSSAFPRRQQGIAGSLVSTFVNYSISIGLGFAGTVEYYTTRNMEPSLETTIHGMRNAFYMGMGLAGVGVILSTIFMIIQLLNRRSLEKNNSSIDELPSSSGEEAPSNEEEVLS